jgi:hypothetical protein
MINGLTMINGSQVKKGKGANPEFLKTHLKTQKSETEARRNFVQKLFRAVVYFVSRL